MLDDRRSKVLKGLVEEYIRTGEPVSSQCVLDRSGLDVSSATIRSDLSRLESYGFVDQPHTSSGRVPSQQGYRFYVDHLAPAKLREVTRQRIDTFFHEVHRQISDVLKDTSTFVNELTTYPAVVIGPTTSTDVIKEVRLVALGGPIVLVVAVADNGRVHQDFVDVGEEVDQEALASAERLLSAAFSGRTLDAPEQDRLSAHDLPAAVKRVISPVSDHLASAHSEEREVYVSGTSQMVSLWNDLTMVQNLLSILEEEAALVELVTDEAEGTHVRFGSDIGRDTDLAVVTTTYETATGGTGQVGVIGPLRMNYQRTIRVVEEVSDGLEDRFGGEA
jgi:heat-inducible transcriptional repressor